MQRGAWSIALLVALAGCGIGTPCTDQGEIYSAHELHGRCCNGLVNLNLMLEPSDNYEGDGLPEGCGTDGNTPPDIMICLPCGDGTCDEGENFCNCPDDCPQP